MRKIKLKLHYLRKNLTYTYTSPHSAHPPGLLLGIVYSTLFQIFKGFLNNIAHGYKGNEIKDLVHKAITCAKTYTGPTAKQEADYNHVILHLPFHPNDPASYHIQEAWHTHVAKPQWKMPLENMKNPKTKEKCIIK